jgi:hypothetical protein
LPKGWKNSVLIILDKAKELLPLMSEEAGKLKVLISQKLPNPMYSIAESDFIQTAF